MIKDPPFPPFFGSANWPSNYSLPSSWCSKEIYEGVPARTHTFTNRIEEGDGALVYEFEVPGIRKEDLQIELKDKNLYVKGTTGSRKISACHGPIDEKVVAATAKLTDGVLTVRLVLSTKSTRRVISIE